MRRLIMQFVYLLLSNPSTPFSPSVLRAYEGGLPLPLPRADSDAYTTTAVPVTGRLFNEHDVEFECQVRILETFGNEQSLRILPQISLLKPAQYALGRPL